MFYSRVFYPSYNTLFRALNVELRKIVEEGIKIDDSWFGKKGFEEFVYIISNLLDEEKVRNILNSEEKVLEDIIYYLFILDAGKDHHYYLSEEIFGNTLRFKTKVHLTNFISLLICKNYNNNKYML